MYFAFKYTETCLVLEGASVLSWDEETSVLEIFACVTADTDAVTVKVACGS